MSFNTFIDMGELGEQEVTVEFDFSPSESQSHEHPGCSASVEITKETWLGLDILHYFDRTDLLVDAAFEYIENIGNQAKEDRAEYMREMRGEQ